MTSGLVATFQIGELGQCCLPFFEEILTLYGHDAEDIANDVAKNIAKVDAEDIAKDDAVVDITTRRTKISGRSRPVFTGQVQTTS